MTSSRLPYQFGIGCHSLQTRAGRHPISTCTSAHVQAAAIALVWNIAGMRDIAPAPAQHAESVLIQRERNYDRDAEAAFVL